jgi:hypothetical protein
MELREGRREKGRERKREGQREGGREPCQTIHVEQRERLEEHEQE